MIEFMLFSLAVWRISSLVARETGPFDIFEKFRKLFRGKSLYPGVICVWCNSVWFAIPAAFLLRIPVGDNAIVAVIIKILAISATCIVIDEFIAYLGRSERL
jgi:hypothetical protein